jgi:hypothetical protein
VDEKHGAGRTGDERSCFVEEKEFLLLHIHLIGVFPRGNVFDAGMIIAGFIFDVTS